MYTVVYNVLLVMLKRKMGKDRAIIGTLLSYVDTFLSGSKGIHSEMITAKWKNNVKLVLLQSPNVS